MAKISFSDEEKRIEGIIRIIEKEWTDNPAWILYDLLTNYRYGMGSHIEISDINKWQLYKIGRFCDAVDENGYFEGVTDGRGGKEPRFSCNVVFEPMMIIIIINSCLK